MFDIAWSELLVVIIVAIVVVGPRELPGLLRTIGRMLGKLRRSADEFRRQFDETMRETGADEIQREINQLRYHNPVTQIRDSIEEAARDVQQAVDIQSHPAPAAETQPAGEAAAAIPAAQPADTRTAPADTQAAPAAGTGDGPASEPRPSGEHRSVN